MPWSVSRLSCRYSFDSVLEATLVHEETMTKLWPVDLMSRIHKKVAQLRLGRVNLKHGVISDVCGSSLGQYTRNSPYRTERTPCVSRSISKELWIQRCGSPVKLELTTHGSNVEQAKSVLDPSKDLSA